MKQNYVTMKKTIDDNNPKKNKVSPRKFVYIYNMTHNRKSIHIFWDSLYFEIKKEKEKK